jgi:hypothetical protein
LCAILCLSISAVYKYAPGYFPMFLFLVMYINPQTPGPRAQPRPHTPPEKEREKERERSLRRGGWWGGQGREGESERAREGTRKSPRVSSGAAPSSFSNAKKRRSRGVCVAHGPGMPANPNRGEMYTSIPSMKGGCVGACTALRLSCAHHPTGLTLSSYRHKHREKHN